jgi:hypothetical protein
MKTKYKASVDVINFKSSSSFALWESARPLSREGGLTPNRGSQLPRDEKLCPSSGQFPTPEEGKLSLGVSNKGPTDYVRFLRRCSPPSRQVQQSSITVT